MVITAGAAKGTAVKVLLINPPYQTLTSNLGVGHQVPLGLLMIGGPLLDAGFDVSLLDAEALRWPSERIASRIARTGIDIVLVGHAGSTPAHPVCTALFRALRCRCPRVITIYGGVFPTYHDRGILEEHPEIDIIVRGEGEATALHLLTVLRRRTPLRAAELAGVSGVTWRDGDRVVRNDDRAAIGDLDAYRVGWELIDDWDRYQCFGLGRAAIVQFSRGCPHRCTYCGQHEFWRSWRSRDHVALADEIQWLHDAHGVRFITLADENPTTDPRKWRALLAEIAARPCEVSFFATIRAADIVRDADVLDLYRRAGVIYVLMGIDAVDPHRIETIKKRSTTTIDEQACALLRKAGIRSMIGHIVGLGEESLGSFRSAWRALVRYDGDLLNVMYATPHVWTPFAQESATRPLVQEDQRLWDYRHQVLGELRIGPRKLFFAVKALELAYHLRPRQLWRLLFTRDTTLRRQRWWTLVHIGAVWFGEIAEFVFKVRFADRPRPLASRLNLTPPRERRKQMFVKVNVPAHERELVPAHAEDDDRV